MDTTSGTMTARGSSRIRDVLKDPKELWQLLKDSVSAWVDDFAPSMGAAHLLLHGVLDRAAAADRDRGGRARLRRRSGAGQIFEQLAG